MSISVGFGANSRIIQAVPTASSLIGDWDMSYVLRLPLALDEACGRQRDL
jgi:hypothetical protein